MEKYLTNEPQKILDADKSRTLIILQNQSDTRMKVSLFKKDESGGLILDADDGTSSSDPIVISGVLAQQEVWGYHLGSGTKKLYYDTQ